ncbi:uncharacterized protein LOC116347501 [Contarinia nasturtii]|uniref:uncharacterized protein LOC116347501 n=1 Tax=Contarinia nasturtii TaxID=265458 RepID=UPI0012D39228|nr:uncharacterized protein LOC116347501 [Contarinia nasturtii]
MKKGTIHAHTNEHSILYLSFTHMYVVSCALLTHMCILMFFLTSDLKDTKYCPTILLPTEHTLKKSLDSILFNSKSGTIPNKIDRIDLCCRTLYKCNLQKTSEINQTVWYIRHCNCVQSFQHCLKSLNTSLSNELYSTFALNATKCISNEQKIVVVSFNASLKVISEISAKMSMDELEKLSKPGIFETPEQTADFIFKVLNVGSSFGCDVYQTFIDEMLQNTITAANTYEHSEQHEYLSKSQFLIKLVRILLKTACDNHKIIKGDVSSTCCMLTETTSANPITQRSSPNINVHYGFFFNSPCKP